MAVLLGLLVLTGMALQPSAGMAATTVQDSSRATMIDTLVVTAEQVDPFRSKTRITSDRDQEELQRFMPLNLADALVSIPGVDVQKTGPWAARPTVRGLSGNRVLVLVDGVRLNSSRGHGAQPGIVGMEAVENVEVSMGAASTEHGTDAMGGVVDIVTRRPLLAPLNMVEGTVTSKGEEPGGAVLLSSVLRYKTPHFGIEATGGLSRLSALETANGKVDNSGYRQENYGIRGEVGFGAMNMDIQHTYGAAKDVGLPAFASPAGGSALYPLRDRRLTRYQIDVQGEGWRPSFSLMGAHQDYLTRFIETTVDSTFRHDRLFTINTNVDNQEITSSTSTLEPSLVFEGAVRARIFGQYHHDETKGPGHSVLTQNFVRAGIVSVQESESENVPPSSRKGYSGGVSLLVPWSVAQVEGGIRYDSFQTKADTTAVSTTHVQDLKEHATSYSLGLSRKFTTRGGVGWQPYLSFNTGFRSPNLDERYFNGFIHGGLWVFGNQDLDPEISRSYEAGFLATDLFDGKVKSLRASFYRSNVDDLITLRYMGQLYLVPRFQYVNIRNARIDGMELAAILRYGPARLDLGASFPHGKDLDTGEPISDVGRTSLSARMSVPLSRGGLRPTLSFRFRWFDKVEDINEKLNTDPVSTASVELVGYYRSLRGAIAIKNLFNRYYAQQLSIIPEPGRTVAISVRSDFYSFLD